MNTAPTLPPDRDLRPATRARRRDELIAILERDSAPANRRRHLVPLAAAAAIVLVVGAAIAVPALRDDKSPGPGGDLPRDDGRTSAVRTSTVEPLSAAEQAALGTNCPGDAPGRFKFKAIDGFKFVNPPSDARTRPAGS
jgi:hypothetical protein